MVVTMRRELLLVLLAAVLLAGVVDALASEAWDFLAVLSIALSLVAVLLTLTSRGRRSIGIRPDLARWLEEEAGTRGESVEALADRAIAAYRAGLSGER